MWPFDVAAQWRGTTDMEKFQLTDSNWCGKPKNNDDHVLKTRPVLPVAHGSSEHGYFVVAPNCLI